MIKYIGKAIRLEKGYSVKKLSQESTIAKSSIWKWEQGDYIPDLSSLDLVSNVLGVCPWDLIEFNGKRFCETNQENKGNTMKAESVWISKTKDCDENLGGWYCQVYADENMEQEIDSFCVRLDDCDCSNEADVEKFIAEYVKQYQ